MKDRDWILIIVTLMIIAISAFFYVSRANGAEPGAGIIFNPKTHQCPQPEIPKEGCTWVCTCFPNGKCVIIECVPEIPEAPAETGLCLDEECAA